MKLIIGLGNPGNEYRLTRHNAGFLCVDFLREPFRCELFRTDAKMAAAVAGGSLSGEKILLVKPATAMNASGDTVRTMMRFYKLSLSDIAVIHDDLDIAPGTYKTTSSSRAAGHNGIQNIIDKVSSQDFFRIRLGIGRPAEVSGVCMPAHDFVLQDFSTDELARLSTLFPVVQEEISRWIKQ